MSDTSNKIFPDAVSGQPYIFVSYSSKDTEQVQEVLRILRDNCFRFWYDMGLKSGDEWTEELGGMIERCDQFLVLISKNAVESKYVRKELGYADKKGKNIIPVYLSDTKLPHSVDFLINDLHAIHRYHFSRAEDFELALCRAASKRTRYQLSDVADTTRPANRAKRELLENYELLDMIGSGGVGEVYTARHKRTGALAAVKCASAGSSYMGTLALKMMKSEMNTLKMLLPDMIPHIPVLLDWFCDDKDAYLVESLMPGRSLAAFIPAKESRVIDIGKKLLLILRELHAKGVIYLDVKPQNVLEDIDGNLSLVDFNSARIAKNSEFHSQEGWACFGTPAFGAPEQATLGLIPRAAADIYSVGRLMEYLLCPEKFTHIHVPVRYNRGEISPLLEEVIEKMTEKDPEMRYSGADEAILALESCERAGFLEKSRAMTRSKKRLINFAAVKAEYEKRQGKAYSAFDHTVQIGTVIPGDTVYSDHTTIIQPMTLDMYRRMSDPTIPPKKGSGGDYIVRTDEDGNIIFPGDEDTR